MTTLHRTYTCSGSFTIEAAIILPMTFAFILQFLILVFTFHDTIISQNISYSYLISDSMKTQDNYAYNDNHYTNLKESCYSSSILKQISYSTIPVTFSNYNHANVLRQYKALQMLAKQNQ